MLEAGDRKTKRRRRPIETREILLISLVVHRLHEAMSNAAEVVL
jgi:hypothetical protein